MTATALDPGRQASAPRWRPGRRTVISTAAVLLFFVAWQLAPETGLVNGTWTSQPSRVAVAAVEVFLTDNFLYHAQISLTEFVLGFGLALAVSMPLGVLLGVSRTARHLLDPPLMALYIAPTLVLLPIMIIWLGIGMASKVAVVFLGAIFPIIVNTMAGMREADQRLVRMAQSFGARRRDVFLRVLVPGRAALDPDRDPPGGGARRAGGGGGRALCQPGRHRLPACHLRRLDAHRPAAGLRAGGQRLRLCADQPGAAAGKPRADMEARAMKRFWQRREAAILGTLSMLSILGLWQLSVSMGWVSEFFVSSPGKVARAFMIHLDRGEIAANVASSLWSFSLALGLAATVGIGLGLLAGWFRDLEAALDPFIWFKYSAPTIAFYPIFIAWLGYGTPTIVAIAFLFALTPIYANTLSGIRNVDADLVRAARSFGARPLDIFLKVALPASVPIIVAGLRLGVGRALTGVVVAELFGASSGLGYAIAYYAQLLQTTNMMVSIVIVVILGVILTQLLSVLEHRADAWRNG
jgi:NitT/TauT family transport system permease protein